MSTLTEDDKKMIAAMEAQVAELNARLGTTIKVAIPNVPGGDFVLPSQASRHEESDFYGLSKAGIRESVRKHALDQIEPVKRDDPTKARYIEKLSNLAEQFVEVSKRKQNVPEYFGGGTRASSWLEYDKVASQIRNTCQMIGGNESITPIFKEIKPFDS